MESVLDFRVMFFFVALARTRRSLEQIESRPQLGEQKPVLRTSIVCVCVPVPIRYDVPLGEGDAKYGPGLDNPQPGEHVIRVICSSRQRVRTLNKVLLHGQKFAKSLLQRNWNRCEMFHRPTR